MTPEFQQMEAARLIDDPSRADEIADKATKHANAIIDNLDNRCAFGWTNILGSAISRANLAALAERRRGSPLSESVRKRLVMNQDDLMAKAFPRLTMTAMYRRYTQIYLLALEDAILILMDCKDLEEAHKRIMARVVETGGAHKADIKKYHSALLREHVFVGED